MVRWPVASGQMVGQAEFEVEVAARSSFRSYQDLDVWQMAMSVAEECYRLTADYPRDERYGISSQIRRSAVSIPANIAEGYGRDQTGQHVQFLRVAMGSARELETHLLLSSRLGLASNEQANPIVERCVRISKMLRSLIRALEDQKSIPG